MRVQDVYPQDWLTIQGDRIQSSWLTEYILPAPLNAREGGQWILQYHSLSYISCMIQVGINCPILVRVRRTVVIEERITDLKPNHQYCLGGKVGNSTRFKVLTGHFFTGPKETKVTLSAKQCFNYPSRFCAACC